MTPIIVVARLTARMSFNEYRLLGAVRCSLPNTSARPDRDRRLPRFARPLWSARRVPGCFDIGCACRARTCRNGRWRPPHNWGHAGQAGGTTPDQGAATMGQGPREADHLRCQHGRVVAPSGPQWCIRHLYRTAAFRVLSRALLAMSLAPGGTGARPGPHSNRPYPVDTGPVLGGPGCRGAGRASHGTRRVVSSHAPHSSVRSWNVALTRRRQNACSATHPMRLVSVVVSPSTDEARPRECWHVLR